jgi:uncharacterized protein YerC
MSSKLSTAERAEIVTLRLEDFTHRDITKKTGRSAMTVWRVLDKAGLKGHRPGKWRHGSVKDHPRIIQLRRTGLSMRAIAKETGWSHTVIWKVIAAKAPRLKKRRDAVA